MSKENVKLFYEALAKDKSLQEKVRVIGKKHEGQKLDEKQAGGVYRKELIPLARQTGYDFTEDELKEYAREAEKPALQELSEDELAAVAGGTWNCDTFTGFSCPDTTGYSVYCDRPGVNCPTMGVV